MKLGAMTNPLADPLAEIAWIGEHGFDFVDLAVEPPHTRPDQLDPAAVRAALQRYGLGVVVHTDPLLPIASPYRSVQDAVQQELVHGVATAAAVGAHLLTLHYRGKPSFFDAAATAAWYAGLLIPLCESAAERGITVALENGPERGEQLRILREVFRRVPRLGLLLDVAHANVGAVKHMTDEYLLDSDVGSRLVHVHVSDNDGSADQHLPLGAPRGGGVPWPRVINSLRRRKYDGTITLEIHSADRDYLLISRDKLRAWWGA
jgi:sugar phosphate isomerase/epimerase